MTSHLEPTPMTTTRPTAGILLASLSLAASCARSGGSASTVTPAGSSALNYTIRIPNPASRTFDVDVVVPTEGRDSVILMMPIWSPGMYTLQSYGDRVTAFQARGADGTAIPTSHPAGSRWIVPTKGRPT